MSDISTGQRHQHSHIAPSSHSHSHYYHSAVGPHHQHPQPYPRMSSPSPPPCSSPPPSSFPVKSSMMVRDSLTQISIPPRPSQLPQRFYSPALSPASTCTSATVSPLSSSSSASSASSSPGLSVSPLAVFPSFTSRYPHPVFLDHFHPTPPSSSYPSFPPPHSLLHPSSSYFLPQPKPRFASVAAAPVSPLSGRSSSYPPAPHVVRPSSGSLKRRLDADALPATASPVPVPDALPSSCSSPSPLPHQSPRGVSSPHSPVSAAYLAASSFTFCPSPHASSEKRRRTMQPPSPLPTHPHTHISPRSLQALYPRAPQTHSPVPLQPSPTPSHSPSFLPMPAPSTPPLPHPIAHHHPQLLPAPTSSRSGSRPPSASLSPSVRRRHFLVPPIAIPSPPPSPLFFASPPSSSSPWLPSPSSVLMPPCPFPALRGRYSVQQSIEQSLFTSVKLATNLATNQQVAIKIARLSSSAPLRREADLLRHIHHPAPATNVIELVELLEDDQYAYLVLRYASGGDLHSLLSGVAGGVVGSGEGQRLFAAVVEGVWALRERGVAHLDLSLENVVVCGDGSVRIIDLGSGCVHPSMAPSPSLVHPLAMAGEAVVGEGQGGGGMPLTYPCAAYPSSLPLPSKPSYSSPELLVNHLPSQPSSATTTTPSSPTSSPQPTTTTTTSTTSPPPQPASFDAYSADIFSLGVLLYLLATGRPPFTRPHPTDPWWTAISTGAWLEAGGVREGSVGKEVYGRVEERVLALIGRMLCVEGKRATLEEVREHEWVKQGREMAEREAGEGKKVEEVEVEKKQAGGVEEKDASDERKLQSCEIFHCWLSQ